MTHRRGSCGARHLLVVFGLVLVSGLLVRSPSTAQTTRPPVDLLRYSKVGVGDYVLVGNTSLTCTTTGYGSFEAGFPCAATQAGSGSGINDHTAMRFVDVDSDSSTFNSSRAQVSLPSGATVDKALLYWGGSTGVCRDNDTPIPPPNPAGRNVASVSVGGAASSLVEASTVYSMNFGALTTYTAQADVTEILPSAGGAFEVTVANVQLTQGRNCFGGWALVVVYTNAAVPCTAGAARSVTIHDGLLVRLGNHLAPETSTTLSGLVSSGGAARVGVLAWEGDRGLFNDLFRVNDVYLADPRLGPVQNFFGSTVDGAASPLYRDNLGIDAKSVTVPAGVIPAGSTSVSIKYQSYEIDVYYPTMVALSTPAPCPVSGPTGSEVLDAAITRQANASDGASRYRVALTVRNARNGAVYTFSSPSGHSPPGGSPTDATASGGVAVLAPYELRNPRGVYRAQVRVGAVVAANAVVE